MFRVSNHVATLLRSYACDSISNAYIAAERDIARYKVTSSQRESWHVAHLCREIGTLAWHWRRELAERMPGITLSMSSVFTHQSPYVKWTNGNSPPSRCELADLLVVVIDRTGRDAKGQATLIQAKMSVNGSVNPNTTSERKQFELLSRRPVFDVDVAAGPTQIDLKKYTPDSALLYGLATKYPVLPGGLYCCYNRRGSTWLVQDELVSLSGESEIVASDSLSSTFFGLLQGNYGWTFRLPPKNSGWQHFAYPGESRDDWSCLINYLLSDTFSKPLSGGHSTAADRANRGQADDLCLISNAALPIKKFFLTNARNDSQIFEYSGGEKSSSGEWISTGREQLSDDGGGLGGSAPGMADDSPNEGAISAILIEVTRES